MNSIARRYQKLLEKLGRKETPAIEPVPLPPDQEDIPSPGRVPPPSRFLPNASAYLSGLRDAYTIAGLTEKVAEIDRDVEEMQRLGDKFNIAFDRRADAGA